MFHALRMSVKGVSVLSCTMKSTRGKDVFESWREVQGDFSKPMRIVQFVNNLDMGGLERLAIDLAECQLADGDEAFIYCLTHPGRLAEEAANKKIVVRAFRKGPGPHVGTLWDIARQLRRDRPDVLHTHNHLVHHYGVAAGRMAGVRVIVNTRHRGEHRLVSTPEGSLITTESTGRKSDWLFRSTLPWTDSVVMISEATRQFFVKYRGVPAGKTRVILNGARLERFFVAPARPGSALPRIRFGIAARLMPEKDHFALLRAFTSVLAEIPQAQLQIAGDGPLRSRLEERARELGIAESVNFLGPVSDVPGFLSRLDIFVLSSLSEGLPISILEAMAAGLPIVSTRAGGVSEAVEDGRNACLVDPADAEGLASAMIRMARRNDLDSLGAVGRQIVQERFRIEDTWRQYRRLFLEHGAKP
jgi:glycosyltransferase involved in cell wall biosynthesis